MNECENGAAKCPKNSVCVNKDVCIVTDLRLFPNCYESASLHV